MRNTVDSFFGGRSMVIDFELKSNTSSNPSRNLQSFSVFSDLSSEEAEIINNIIIKKRFLKDQLILSEEDTSNFMYLVYSGKVRVVKINDEGREQIITFHRKGDCFGEMALLDGETSPASVIAHEDAVVGLLHRKDFETFMLDHQEIRHKIIKVLCSRLRDAWSMIKILSFDSAEHRVIVVLDRLRERYGIYDKRGIIISIKLTHQMLANYAAVSRETATRVLKKLEEAGEILCLENKTFLLRESFFHQAKEVQYSSGH